MTIKVETLDKFVGVVQSRDYRKPTCSGYGENAKVTFLRVNMLAEPEDQDYCGVFLHEVKRQGRTEVVELGKGNFSCSFSTTGPLIILYFDSNLQNVFQ